METKQAKKIINEIIKEQSGVELFNEEGNIQFEKLKAIFKNNDFPISENINRIIVEKKETQDVEVSYDGEDELKVYVPEIIQKKIRFSINYLFSQFDKINYNISEIRVQLTQNEISTIRRNRELILEESTLEPSDYILQQIEISSDRLKENTCRIIKETNKIERNRVKRLLSKRSAITTALENNKIAINSLHYYLEGMVLLSELYLRIGKKIQCLSRIEEAIAFLNEFTESEYRRMEGWNSHKNGFWIEKPKEYISFLTEKCEEIQKNDDKLIINIKED